MMGNSQINIALIHSLGSLLNHELQEIGVKCSIACESGTSIPMVKHETLPVAVKYEWETDITVTFPKEKDNMPDKSPADI